MEKVPLQGGIWMGKAQGMGYAQALQCGNLCVLAEVVVKSLHLRWKLLMCISSRSHCHPGRCFRKNVCLHLEPASGNSLVLSCQGEDFVLRLYISLGVTGVPTAHSLLLKLWGESFSKKGEWTAADNLTGYIFKFVSVCLEHLFITA